MSRSSPDPRASARRDPRGFTLLEVVVAFAILGLAFGAAFEVFSTGVRNVGASGEYVLALLNAESKMATLGVVEPLVEGSSEGEIDDTYRWRLDVIPVEIEAVSSPRPEAETAAAEAPPAEDPGRPRLARLALEVSWGAGAGRSVRLESFRLIEDPPR